MSQASSTAVTRWIFSHLAPYKLRVAAALTALLVGALSWLALGQGVRVAVDEGFVADNAAMLDQTLVVVLGIALLGALAAYVRFYLMIWLGERVSADIRREVYDHLLSLSPSFFEQTRTGEVISRFTSDTTVLQSVVGMGLSMALRSGVTFLGALGLMLVTSPQLTLYVLVCVPLVLLPIKLLGGRVRRFARTSQDRVADLGSHVDESLHEIQTVQAYTREQRNRQAFADKVEDVMDAASQRIRARALLIASIMAISVSAIVLVAWLGAHQVLDGGISAGELTAFMFYAVMAGGAVATLSEVLGEIQKAAGASERLLELLDSVPDVISPVALHVQSAKLPRQARQVSLQGLTFAYPSAPELSVLQDINLSVAPGERIALVGPSGAGKSSVFQLLLRFYDAQQGQILIDDVPTHTMSLDALRKTFALVPQESVIFATTALENIRYGRPDATEEEVVAAAKAARADEFIRALPQGYESELGERGVRLSGGQKQRIAIARAILADRPVLLLDEATSALDATSEKQVKQALDALMANKTTLIIAHRLATVVNADRIVVMDKGRIQAIGKHDELVAGNSLYREFAELQLVS